MLVDDLVTKTALERMVRGATTNETLRDDLMQEALVHLWQTETRRPGQTRSWYVRSCHFHVKHYLAAGRSVDSAKRRYAQVDAEEGEDGEEMQEFDRRWEDTALDVVELRDLFSLLSGRLGRDGQAVLRWLAEGLSTREIGRRLGISHTMVVKHRHKIAALVARLDGDHSGFLPGAGSGREHRAGALTAPLGSRG